MHAHAAARTIAAPSAAKAWMRALELTGRIDAEPERTLPQVIEEMAERRPRSPALVSDGETFAYAELAGRARRYARWGLAEGLKPGAVVALMMPNRPDYMAIWLGLTRIGLVVALINTQLTTEALRHALAVAAPQRLIVDDRLLEALEAALAGAEDPPPIWVHGAANGPHPRLDLAVAAFPQAQLGRAEQPRVTLSDPALLIYTSGTTGRSKAARVSHHRAMMWSHWFAGMTGAGPDDRLYNCLPMHHSVGGVVAVGSVLVAGGSAAIAERFSASRFWADVVRFDCTLVQYIGELCRYLLAAPPTPEEGRHRVRLFCGNGMGREVWARFQARFGAPQILEFYAATEGNFSLYNAEGRPGAIGRVPPFLAHRFAVAIVRADPVTEMPMRDAEGRCIRCGQDEAGEAIGRISEGAGALAARFEGYTDAAESDRKVLRDVFAPGDAWFRTGDLMRKDAQGFYYFVDRIGDTFRWKGENVATTEVAEALCGYPGVAAASVYGVQVPGCEGRAGMAALTVGSDFVLAGLGPHLTERLPAYARPLFLRMPAVLEATETFKPKKHGLMNEGFDPGRIDDPLFVLEGDRYVPLDEAVYAAIVAGRRRL